MQQTEPQRLPNPACTGCSGPWLLLLFIVGDILGTGIYALTGQVAKQVGGVVWLPFLVAFVVALVTAFSYLELVTKYPKAAGAALYAHRAFGIHFVTFIVAFAVMCSGITSASTASRAFAANLSARIRARFRRRPRHHADRPRLHGGGRDVNFRGVGESVKANVVLTCVELTGLLIIIVIGLWAIGAGKGDVSRVTEFRTAPDRGAVLGGDRRDHARLLRHGRLRGFGQHGRGDARIRPKIFPKVLLAGLLITGTIYVLVSISAITLVSPEELGEGETPLLKVVQAGAPGFPLGIFGVITMFAVANSALINMLMASRLVYGMSRERVLPPVLGKVHADAPHALHRDSLHHAARLRADHLRRRGAGARRHHGAAAALRLHRRQHRGAGAAQGQVEHEHFRTPTFLPVVGAHRLRLLRRPVDRPRSEAVRIAGMLLGIGVVLWS